MPPDTSLGVASLPAAPPVPVRSILRQTSAYSGAGDESPAASTAAQQADGSSVSEGSSASSAMDQHLDSLRQGIADNQNATAGVSSSAAQPHTSTQQRAAYVPRQQRREQREARGDLSERAVRHAAREERLRQQLDGLSRASRRRQRTDEEVAEDAGPPAQRLRTETGRAFFAHCSADFSEAEKAWDTGLGLDEPLFDNGKLHPTVLQALGNCAGGMDVKLKDGRVYLAPSTHVPLGSTQRSFDFTALQAVSAILAEKPAQKKFTFKLLAGDNRPCFLMSQLLNGECIQSKLNARDNRGEMQYFCTAVEIGRDQLPAERLRGNYCLVAWGDTMAPRFLSIEEAHCDFAGCFVARVYYDVMDDVHEAAEAYTREKGLKSSALTITLEDAAAVGLSSYIYAAICAEALAIDRHGVLGERFKKAELTRLKRNLVTSRLLITIKVDRTTGLLIKFKVRWISRGFQDRRFFQNRVGDIPSCRSHTAHDASITLVAQFVSDRDCFPSCR
ncbi:unnamed protein product [Amoebophrya sp. A25]|nr:unnamed protein product [Amoebophrya sp. A25]|eukprot:GSA25T00019586001.1